MHWFLIIILYSNYVARPAVIGPIDSKYECLKIEQQYKLHIVSASGNLSVDTDCVSGARP